MKKCNSQLFFLLALLSAALWAEDSSPVNMLVPGFTVRELPIETTNINNLEYAPDGRLFALGYDGRVHIFSDTDGDGLEDNDKIYWANSNGEFRGPVGLLLAPEGVYVSSKGKVSLLPDADHDDVADKLEVVTTGWKECFTNVDALGIAKDSEGNLYFGIGCANFSNPYLIDKATGKAAYDLKDEHGTILKVSADHSRRESICTGIRFPVSIKFNRNGDLFATDQEGATWCPGGNVVDELIHVIPGRHYGFPPRHPEHLPNVVDEPNVCSFGPQHQSACGLKFNEAREGWKSFGPAEWEGDAFVAGESRGKIYRCKLVKTPQGYVGSRPYIIAALKMLPIDIAISPKGDMVVCCHSGPPDWGTGPKGAGKLFKISYTDPAAPQPVISWAASPTEVRVAFDKPLDPSVTHSVCELRAGEFVRAADRYETLVPPYVAVKAQRLAGYRPVKIESQKLADDGRTLVLSTEPLPWRSSYALAIPGVKAPGAQGFGHTVDVDFDLSGVNLELTIDPKVKPAWQGWLPHTDPAVSLALTKGSALHEKLSTSLESAKASAAPGFPTLRGSILITAPVSNLTLQAKAGNPVALAVQSQQNPGKQTKLPDGFAYDVACNVGNGPLSLFVNWSSFSLEKPANISYHSNVDPNERPLRLDQLVLSWAAELPRQTVPTETNPYLQVPATPPTHPLIAGGDWQKGRDLFFGEAKCASCHSVKGEGAHFAPDLSNLAFRDPESVQRDIVDPNLSINPDFVSYLVKLNDGRVLTGLVQPAENDQLRIVENAEKVTLIKKNEIKEMRASSQSIMPAGFKELLGAEKLKDVLTFLTSEPPKKK